MLGGPLAGTAAVEPTSMKVEVESIDPAGVAKVSKQNDVLCVAPSIPMRLIAPTCQRCPRPRAAWGLKAVGADTSPFTGDGIMVAVLDTGIDASHPAFAGVTDQEDFTGEGDGDITVTERTAPARFSAATSTAAHRRRPRREKGADRQGARQQGGGSEQIVKAIQWAVERAPT